MSNLPGPNSMVYWPVSGKEDDSFPTGLVDSVFFVTSPPFRFGPLVSVISYNGVFHFSISARASVLSQKALDWILTEGLETAVRDIEAAC
jgi:hypothetical protein